MGKKLLLILGVIFIVAAVAIWSLVEKKADRSPALTQQQIDQKLLAGFSKAAEQENARGPVMIDQDTRWDRSVAGPGPQLTYYYSFPHYASKDIDANKLFAKLRANVKKGVCSSKEMKPSLQAGGTYVYAYAGNDGVEITRFELSKGDCGY